MLFEQVDLHAVVIDRDRGCFRACRLDRSQRVVPRRCFHDCVIAGVEEGRDGFRDALHAARGRHHTRVVDGAPVDLERALREQAP